jgi:succinylglutamate desuccinylase
MSREIIFYAEKNRNPETRIELYWTGAESAQLLFEGFKDLSYQNSEGYIEIGKATREARAALDVQIEKYADMIKRYEDFIEEYRLTMKNISTVELYDEVMSRIIEYRNEIKEFQEDIEFYKGLKQHLITICNLDFLQASYDGTPSEWELYVLYSY